MRAILRSQCALFVAIALSCSQTLHSQPGPEPSDVGANVDRGKISFRFPIPYRQVKVPDPPIVGHFAWRVVVSTDSTLSIVLASDTAMRSNRIRDVVNGSSLRLCKGAVAAHAEATFSLDIERVVALPDSLSIAGATIDDRGAVVAWFHQGSVILVAPSEGTSRLFPIANGIRPVGAWSVNGSGLQVYDGKTNSVFEMDLEGSFRPLTRFSLKEEAVYANHTSSGAWLVHTLSDSVAELLHATNKGLRRVHREAALGQSMPFQAIERGMDVVVTFRDPRRGVWRLDSAGNVLSRTSLVSGETPPHDSAVWIGLSTVSVNRSLVSTVADVRSESRRFVVLDSAFVVQRATKVAGLMSLLTSAPSAPLILSIRSINSPELVIYRVRWHNTSSNTENIR